jgi:hypothetical protein
MEVTTAEQDGHSKMKQRFIAARRKIKEIDLRQSVVDNPFAAVGIGLAVGAAIALIRPKPQPGRITGALVSAAGVLVYRLVRDAAIVELGRYASQLLSNPQERPATDAPF